MWDNFTQMEKVIGEAGQERKRRDYFECKNCSVTFDKLEIESLHVLSSSIVEFFEQVLVLHTTSC